jgi:FAD:protein FMN transferase
LIVFSLLNGNMASSMQTSRRDFLRGKGVQQAAGNLVELPNGEPHRCTHADSLITVSRRAMACQFQIAIPATRRTAIAAASAAMDTIEQLEAQMTVYDESSEVSGINRYAAAAPVPVESRLFDLFETALGVTDETEGAFDIAAGALVKAWGFFRGPKRVPDPAELASVMERVGSRHITLDRTARTIRLGEHGVELNLGAIGKGYALDRAAEVLIRDWQVTSALLHGGQSSVLAVGSFADRDAQENGWLVTIGDPHRPGQPVASLRLKDCALGTSGASIQFIAVAGRRYGHVLDPRTGWATERQACVSVIAPTAALADALSTAFFILGPEKAAEYCQRHADVGVVVVSNDKQATRADRVTLVGCAGGIVELNPEAGV